MHYNTYREGEMVWGRDEKEERRGEERRVKERRGEERRSGGGGAGQGWR